MIAISLKILPKAADGLMVEENAMDHPIEASRASDGRWVATMSRIPDLVVYGDSREDALVSARKLSAILRHEGLQGDGRILAFHPWRIPAYARRGFSS